MSSVGRDDELPAGEFSAWFGEFTAALRGERSADVPCGRCTACCASSQFVHVAPDETDTLAHIPSELLVPAPGMPAGHVVLGYDDRGRCPMLGDDGCSIYEHRPQACRTFDCRVFAAAGVNVDEDKVLLAERVERWRFDHPEAVDVQLHDAVRSAAQQLARSEPARPAEIAVRAVGIADRQSRSSRRQRA